jgi:hypothetical protein
LTYRVLCCQEELICQFRMIHRQLLSRWFHHENESRNRKAPVLLIMFSIRLFVMSVIRLLDRDAP